METVFTLEVALMIPRYFARRDSYLSIGVIKFIYEKMVIRVWCEGEW